MAKKFVPTEEQLHQILSLYEKTKNYSYVSRETGLSVLIIKRILQESAEPKNDDFVEPPKPKTTAQILAYKKEYRYQGLPPIETTCPKKTVYYGKMVRLKQEFLDV